MNLSEIIYENVTAEYGLGKYGDFKVLIRRKDGYINATKLCKDGGRRFSHWVENERSRELLSEGGACRNSGKRNTPRHFKRLSRYLRSSSPGTPHCFLDLFQVRCHGL